MSRLPLIHIPHGIYSVTSKCNNNEFLFNSDGKFQMYIRHLIQCKKKLGFKIYDVTCMSNHVHELYRVPESVTIAKILCEVKGGFSQVFNAHFGRSGHFWRSKSYYRIVEDENYAIAILHYNHHNPVRAGMVINPEEWPYSGYKFHILGQRYGLIAELLDPIEGITAEEPAEHLMSAVKKAFERKRQRFIGQKLYRNYMQKKFGNPKVAGTFV